MARPYMAIASGFPLGCPFLRADGFLLTNSLDGLEWEFLIAVKRKGQVFSMFLNASFRFSELKAFSASISKTTSAEVLLY